MLAHAGIHHPPPKYSQMSSVRKQGWGGDGPAGNTQILLNGRDGDEETSTSKRHGVGDSGPWAHSSWKSHMGQGCSRVSNFALNQLGSETTHFSLYFRQLKAERERTEKSLLKEKLLKL